MFGISSNCVLAIPAWDYYTVDPVTLAEFRALRGWLETQHGDELCDCDWNEQNSDGSCNRPDHSWWTGRGSNWAYNHGCDQVHIWNKPLHAKATSILGCGDTYKEFALLGACLDDMVAQAEADLSGEEEDEDREDEET